MCSLHYLNWGTLSPFPAEPEQIGLIGTGTCAAVAPGQRAVHGFHSEGAVRHQPGRSALPGLRRLTSETSSLHAETHRQFRSVLGLWPVSALPGDAEESRIGLRRKIGATAPASLTQRGFPWAGWFRHC